MSVEAMAAVLHHSRAKGTAKLVLLGIANHEGDGGAWPSVATLATYANVTDRNVQKAIDGLVSKGELRRDVQAGGPAGMEDRHRPNRYHVLVQCPPWCDRSTAHRDTRQPLWITGVSDATSGVDSDTPPPSDTTPPPPSLATPKPSTQPDPPSLGTAPQERGGWCDVCSLAPDLCYRSQLVLTPEARHPYTPAGVKA